MQRRLGGFGRQLAVVVLALSLVVAIAAPASATYCVKRNDQYVVCVDA